MRNFDFCRKLLALLIKNVFLFKKQPGLRSKLNYIPKRKEDLNSMVKS